MAEADAATLALQLLLPPPDESTLQYFQLITQRVSDVIEVRLDAGDGKGKGIFALKDFEEGEVIFREPTLAGAQHTANRSHALVCSHCFRYIGSIEHQIARRLLPPTSTAAVASPPEGARTIPQRCTPHGADHSHHSAEASSTADHSDHRHTTPATQTVAGTSQSTGGACHSSASAGQSSAPAGQPPLGDGQAVSDDTARLAEWLGPLLDGSALLPHSSAFPMPCVVPCPGGCSDDSYCSTACGRTAWGGYHRLLCTGGANVGVDNERRSGLRERSPPSGGDRVTKRSRGHSRASLASLTGGHATSTVGIGSEPTSATAAAALGATAAAKSGSGCSAERRAALEAFKAHADTTNDIFHVAAHVVASVLLRAQEVLREGASHLGLTPELSGLPSGPQSAPKACWAALQTAWLPYGCAWKAVWWEAVAVPSDVRDEGAFRAELRGLAAESAALLRGALYDARFPSLFELPVYGSIIGMFELNNLGVVVASPVEDYFLRIDELEEPDRSASQAVTGPLLDALDKGYDIPAEGTGFYALQSCANHSCDPNAHTLKGEDDVDGATVVTARRRIRKGEEISISYIDEEAPLEERQELLRDYGFVCCCSRCKAGV